MPLITSLQPTYRPARRALSLHCTLIFSQACVHPKLGTFGTSFSSPLRPSQQLHAAVISHVSKAMDTTRLQPDGWASGPVQASGWTRKLVCHLHIVMLCKLNVPCGFSAFIHAQAQILLLAPGHANGLAADETCKHIVPRAQLIELPPHPRSQKQESTST